MTIKGKIKYEVLNGHLDLGAWVRNLNGSWPTRSAQAGFETPTLDLDSRNKYQVGYRGITS